VQRDYARWKAKIAGPYDTVEEAQKVAFGWVEAECAMLNRRRKRR
jgi:hypothetical protein